MTNSNIRRKPITRQCRNCGRDFKIHQCYLDKSPNKGQWCSIACRNSDGGWHPRQGARCLPVDDKTIALEYHSGLSAPVIARKYGTSVNPIYAALHRQNVVVDRRNFACEPSHVAAEINRQRWITNNPNARRDLPTDDICAAYRDGMSSGQIAAQYQCSVDSVLTRVRKAGITVRAAGYVTNVVCSDGHVANSGWERDVDEWLTAHGIVHEIHPRTPWYTKTARSYADFLVGDVYIELWGIANNARYKARRIEKTAKYHEHSVKLIELYPQHILARDFSPLFMLLP